MLTPAPSTYHFDCSIDTGKDVLDCVDISGQHLGFALDQNCSLDIEFAQRSCGRTNDIPTRVRENRCYIGSAVFNCNDSRLRNCRVCVGLVLNHGDA